VCKAKPPGFRALRRLADTEPRLNAAVPGEREKVTDRGGGQGQGAASAAGGDGCGQDAAQNLKEPAQQAARAVKDTATDAAATVKEEGTSAAQDVQGTPRTPTNRCRTSRAERGLLERLQAPANLFGGGHWLCQSQVAP